jgi:hypothetical protein
MAYPNSWNPLAGRGSGNSESKDLTFFCRHYPS